MRNRLLCIIGVIILTIIVFSGSIGNNFIENSDDYAYILHNDCITDLSWNGIKTMFSSFYSSNYHPLTALSNAIEYKLFGLDPKPYHINNLLLHLFNIILVFQLIYLLTKRTEAALFVSLFFAIHPMHVESVSWIAERKDVLYSFFYLSALLLYVKRHEQSTIDKQRSKFYFSSLFLFFLSLLSKSAAVTLPLILLLVDYFQDRKIDKKSIVEKFPFFVLSIIFGVVALYSQGTSKAMDLTPEFSFYERLLLGSYSLVFYFFKFFIPINLSIYHLYPIKTNGLFPIEYYIAPILLLCMIWGLLKIKNNKREFVFGVLFFFASLCLVIQVIPVGRAITAERYTYIPYIGLLFILSKLYCSILYSDSKKLNYFFSSIIIIYVTSFCYATYNRNKAWKDSKTLYTDMIKKYPDVAYGYFCLASSKQSLGEYKGALENYTQAIELDPKTENPFYNRGNVKIKLKDYRGALEDYTKAIELSPELVDAYDNRGNVRHLLNDHKGAIEDYNTSIRLKPDFSKAYNNRAMAKSSLKDYNGAIADLGIATRIDPNYIDAYNNRGSIKGMEGDYKGAIEDFTFVLQLKPDYGGAYFNRGYAKYFLKDTTAACEDWHMADKLGFTDAKKWIESNCKRSLSPALSKGKGE